MSYDNRTADENAPSMALERERLLTEYLLATYGALIGLRQLAQILGTTEPALRLRQHRRRDLPTGLPGVVGYLWPTPVIGAWLMAQSSPTNEPVTLRRSGSSRGGRPRKIATTRMVAETP